MYSCSILALKCRCTLFGRRTVILCAHGHIYNCVHVCTQAVSAIRNLPYEITDGKALTRKATKVAGVGKKLAELIDRFLQTGLLGFHMELGQSNSSIWAVRLVYFMFKWIVY